MLSVLQAPTDDATDRRTAPTDCYRNPVRLADAAGPDPAAPPKRVQLTIAPDDGGQTSCCQATLKW
jgi:hypothetical protein